MDDFPFGRIGFDAAAEPDGIAVVVRDTEGPGILGLAKVLANQYSRDGILVNNVTPGYILTDRQKEIRMIALCP